MRKEKRMGKLKEISILHINTAKDWRGGEKQTYYLASHLHKRGYRSHCICQRDSILYQKLVSDSIPSFSVRMRSEFDVYAALQIAKIARELNVKILHMHTAHAHSLGLISNLFYRIPVNIVSRRVDYRVGSNFLSRYKYNYPETYIAVSNAVRDILIEDGIPSEKVIAVHSGVDFNTYKNIETDYLFDEYNEICNLSDRIRIINVAALTPQKDHETLIRAMSTVVKYNNNFLLFILGEGKLKYRLSGLRDKLGLRDYIIFTGYRDDVINFIKFSDIFVLSSKWEGLGTSIIDAMALQKPVIATSTGGIPELIESGSSGMLVGKEDPEELAHVIIHLAGNRDIQKKMAENAYIRALDFSINNTIEKTLGVYNRMAGELI
ncbi:MAG: glycosyltransferase [Spirochaetota bacterium]|nr:glycosyltransferase [Spirochaetota bacterium]